MSRIQIRISILFAVSILLLAGGCSSKAQKSILTVHYLGHSSFIFIFDNGTTILTDYGKSNSYGLDSPIHEIGEFKPTVVTYSHHHEDHDRGQAFPGATIVDGKDLISNGISIRAIPVSERSRGDNCAYLIEYKNLKVLHAGDVQGDMISLSDASVRAYFDEHFPKDLDLLLIPIGFVRPITQDAAAFVEMIHPRAIIPMHYWSQEEKTDFLELLQSNEGKYTILECGSSWSVSIQNGSSQILVVSMTPSAPEKE